MAGCDIESSRVTAVRASGVALEQVILSDVVIERSAQFANATMSSVLFDGCEMYGIGGTYDLRGASLRGQDLASLTPSLAQDAGINLID